MTIEEIDKIIEEAKNCGYFATRNDIAYTLLRDMVGNEAAAYLAFKTMPTNLPKYANGSKVKYMRKKLDSIIKIVGKEDKNAKGGKINLSAYTKEENQRRMLAEIENINEKERRGEYDTEKAAITRVKIYAELNKNFDMEKSEDERRIIVVPQKHDIVCPHSHRECTYMPTKEACMKYYNLKEK